MAISHLLRLESASHINRIGILRARVLYSSFPSDGNCEKKPQPKKSELAKQQKAQTVELFVKKYMEENQGVFPKATHVQNEVGGSWYNLKGMLQNIKEKLMGKFDERNCSDAFTSTSDPKFSSDIPSHKVDDNSGDEPQIHEHAVQADTTVISDNAQHASCAMPSLDGQSSSPEVVSATAPDTLKLQNSNSLKHSQIVPRLVKIFQNPKTAGKENNQKMASEEILSGIISVIKDGKSRLDEVSRFNSLLPSETTKELQNLVVDESGYSGYKNFPPKDNPFSLRTCTRTKMDRQSLQSDNTHEMIRLKHHPVDGMKDQAAEGISNTISDTYLPNFFQQSSEPSRDTAGGSSDIKGLIDCVKALPHPSVGGPQETIISNKSDHGSGRTTITCIQRSGNMPKFEKKERLMSSMLDQGGQSLVDVPKSNKKVGKASSLYYHAMLEKSDIGGPFKKLPGYLNTKDQETSSAALDSNKSNARIEVVPLRDNGNLNKTLNATSFRKESDQNKVIVKFLPKMAGHEDIIDAFKDYGDISKVEISGTEGAFFNAAYIYFGSNEGMKKALERTDVKVRNYTVTVEAASSLKYVTRTCVPDLIGHPDVPTALVNNPKQTVMITNLAHDIRSHHIEDALSFCKSKISQLFLGSSSTVAYVEFETEEGKENALTRHSINVLGRRLLILRVDVPRTTVVRISNLVRVPSKEVITLCKSFAKLRTVLRRSEDTMDVHFKLAEWPNMVTILNRLNGSEVDGQQLIAQPAPVYPPDVLEALWSLPEGRLHLKSSVHSLLKKLRDNNPSEVGISELVDSLFEDRVGN